MIHLRPLVTDGVQDRLIGATTAIPGKGRHIYCGGAAPRRAPPGEKRHIYCGGAAVDLVLTSEKKRDGWAEYEFVAIAPGEAYRAQHPLEGQCTVGEHPRARSDIICLPALDQDSALGQSGERSYDCHDGWEARPGEQIEDLIKRGLWSLESSAKTGLRCRVCQAPAGNRCAQCSRALYCARACQKADWAWHRRSCSLG